MAAPVTERQLDLLRGPRQRGKRAPAPTEFAVHCAIADTLKRWIAPGWCAFHVPNGEKRDEATAGRLKRMLTTPGVSDFILFGPPHGSLHALELKRLHQRPTLAQAAFLETVRNAGGKAVWVDSYDEAIDALMSWRALVAGFERRADGSIVVRRREGA
jgi:hypothetical protein